MDTKTQKELTDIAKKVIQSLLDDEEIEITITSDDLVHIGPGPLYITIRKKHKNNRGSHCCHSGNL